MSEHSERIVELTPESFDRFDKMFTAGAYQGQRYGQAFVNKFGYKCDHEHGAKPCLFYETNDHRARKAAQALLAKKLYG